MDPTEFFRVAEELAGKPDSASRRAAVSRFYFALYNAAWQFAKQLPPRPGELSGDGTDHGKLRGLLIKVGGRETAHALAALHEPRKDADYLNRCPTDEEFESKFEPAVQTARKGWKALQELDLEQARERYKKINSPS